MTWGAMNMYIEIAPVAAQTIAQVENDFDFLSDEYKELFGRSDATAFQRPLWLHCIYTLLAPGIGAKPHIITARSCTGELRMVIPLVLQRSMDVTVLQPADLGVSDYNRIVASDETLSSLSRDGAFLKRVRALLEPADVLIFRKIQRSPAIVAAILGNGKPTLNENAGYELALGGGTFDEWQKAALKKKFRNSIRRRRRGLEEDHTNVEFVTFTSPADIEKAIRFIRDLRTVRFKDDILRDAYFNFYLRYAIDGAASGEAVTSGLVADGRLISADFGIVNANAHHSILCASRLDEYGQYSPGLQSLFDLIRRSHERGQVRFDFGIGKTRQKSDFGSTEIPLYNLTIAMSMSGQMISLIFNRAKPLKTFLRRLVGRIR